MVKKLLLPKRILASSWEIKASTIIALECFSWKMLQVIALNSTTQALMAFAVTIHMMVRQTLWLLCCEEVKTQKKNVMLMRMERYYVARRLAMCEICATFAAFSKIGLAWCCWLQPWSINESFRNYRERKNKCRQIRASISRLGCEATYDLINCYSVSIVLMPIIVFDY